jgi:membrane associated rhomboid family serine protease
VISLIPIADHNPTRRTAWVTYLLIALNVIVFLREPIADELPFVGGVTTQAEACSDLAFFRRYAAIPRELTSNEQLPETAGPPVPGGCRAVPSDGRKVPALSVLYAMFLHGSWLHLLGNMLFLYVFGNNVEDRIGRLRYLLFYLLCGYIATYVFAFANAGGTETLVGASGAIAGVLGAYLLLYPRARVTSLVPFLFFIPFRLPAWVVLGSWFLLQWLYASGGTMAEGSSVAYLAHVAGFIAGMILIAVFGGLRRPPRPAPPAWPGPAGGQPWDRY